MGASVEMFLSDPSLSMMWLSLLGTAILRSHASLWNDAHRPHEPA
jgi:hypothetical protein